VAQPIKQTRWADTLVAAESVHSLGYNWLVGNLSECPLLLQVILFTPPPTLLNAYPYIATAYPFIDPYSALRRGHQGEGGASVADN